MKAIQLVRYGNASNAFQINEIERKDPGPNEVGIKVHYSGLNFADVMARRGLYPDAPPNPAVLGYDVTGTVESVGSEVTEFKPGDKVTALSRFGGYAEYVNTMSEGVVRIPEGYDEAAATALATQACTAYYAAAYMVKLRKGDKVLVHAAAGGVGSIICQIAKSKGCEIYGTASPSKHDLLREAGVDHPVDYRNKDFYEVISQLAGGHKLDFAFDSIGGKTFRKSYKLLQACGTIVSYGAADQLSGGNKLKALGAALGFGIYSPIQFLMASKSLIAINMLRVADHRPQLFKELFESVIAMAQEGIIRPRVAKVFEHTEMDKAHELLESRKSAGKVVVRWS